MPLYRVFMSHSTCDTQYFIYIFFLWNPLNILNITFILFCHIFIYNNNIFRKSIKNVLRSCTWFYNACLLKPIGNNVDTNVIHLGPIYGWFCCSYLSLFRHTTNLHVGCNLLWPVTDLVDQFVFFLLFQQTLLSFSNKFCMILFGLKKYFLYKQV